MPRLFVAVWPPDDVVEVVRDLPRPALDGVRWTRPDQWHVTMRFLGSVPDGQVGDVLDRVRGVAEEGAPAEVALGPTTARLARGILVVPVGGLAELASAVVRATVDFGAPPDDRPFQGHLTLARSKQHLPPAVLALPVEATWTATHLAVVVSDTRPDGARYEDLARFRLGRGR